MSPPGSERMRHRHDAPTHTGAAMRNLSGYAAVLRDSPRH